MEYKELESLLNDKLCLGYKLLEQLNDRTEEGISKLKNEITKEIRILEKKHLDKTIKVENIKCTNLTHFHALTRVILCVPTLVAVERQIPLGQFKIKIDLILNDGRVWIKVITRKCKSLQMACNGEGNYGSKNIVDHAWEYIECAKLNPTALRPRIIFYFTNPIDEGLRVNFQGIKVDLIDDLEELKKLTIQRGPIVTAALNLDVSTLIAYVSNVTNGHATCSLRQKILREQAISEQKTPLKPVLDEVFSQARSLIVCETVLKCFMDIVNTVGGPEEKIRSEKLLERVKVYPDDYELNSSSGSRRPLAMGGKIKLRSKIIFEFGERMGAVTCTANDGFVRAARQQNVEFAVVVHESRALTEQNEIHVDL